MNIQDLRIAVANFFAGVFDISNLDPQANDPLVMVTLISKGGQLSDSFSQIVSKRTEIVSNMRLKDMISAGFQLVASIIISLPFINRKKMIKNQFGSSLVWMTSEGDAIIVTVIGDENDAEYLCNQLFQYLSQPEE